jgi:protein-S-isoprenylcysteine O-methyltransferase Ste14
MDEAQSSMNDLGPAIGWAVFGILHSALASRAGTALLRRTFGTFHRLVYNAVAIGTLAPLLAYSALVHGDVLFRWEGPLVAVRYAALAGVVLLFLAGGRHYSMGQLLGFAQLRRATASGAGARGALDSTGVLGVIRHPWYAACLLLIWARDLDVPALAANVVVTVYVIVGTLLEERKLVAEFGEEYRAYQRRVSMFVPLKWVVARLRRAQPPSLSRRSARF